MLRAWLLLQICLVPAAIGVQLLARSARPRLALTVGRGLLVLALIAPTAWSWEPPSLSSPAPSPSEVTGAQTTGPVVGPQAAARRAPSLPRLPVWPLGLGVVGAVALAGLGLKRRVDGLPGRRIRGVWVVQDRAAWSAWLPGMPVVALGGGDSRLALRHELQHLRQGDPIWAWALLGLKALCLPNPAVHLLTRGLRDLEELAVDAALLARNTPPIPYGRALLEAARGARPLVAVGLHTPTLLERRLLMLKKNKTAGSRLPLLALGLLCSMGTLGVAYAGQTRLPVAQERAAFQVPEHAVTDAARARMEGDLAGFVARGLERYPQWAPMVHAELEAWGLPPELAAVPLIESGYENLGAGVQGNSAAPGVPGKGLWMFIPTTARSYGLRVDSQVDERLEPQLETQAAAALLSDLYGEFGDWGLALAGYNQGSEHVQQAIAAEGTRDWGTLVERGALNRYSALVFAASEKLPDQ